MSVFEMVQDSDARLFLESNFHCKRCSEVRAVAVDQPTPISSYVSSSAELITSKAFKRAWDGSNAPLVFRSRSMSELLSPNPLTDEPKMLQEHPKRKLKNFGTEKALIGGLTDDILLYQWLFNA